MIDSDAIRFLVYYIFEFMFQKYELGFINVTFEN